MIMHHRSRTCTSHFDVANKPNGREQLRLDVATDLAALGAGTMIYLPHGEGAQITYAGSPGHLIIAKNKENSGIRHFHEKDEENIAHKQTPAQLLYNVRVADLPNLENLLGNYGTIDLVAYDGTAAGAAYISEVMWGSDAVKTMPQVASGLRLPTALRQRSVLVKINGHCGSIKRTRPLVQHT